MSITHAEPHTKEGVVCHMGSVGYRTGSGQRFRGSSKEFVFVMVEFSTEYAGGGGACVERDTGTNEQCCGWTEERSCGQGEWLRTLSVLGSGVSHARSQTSIGR